MAQMRPPSKSTLLKVVILGDGGVGKSCLMNRFVANRYDESNFRTIGVEFMNRDIEVDGEKFTLQIWDTAGQERFRSLRTPFYRGTDVCLLCYAVDQRNSFQALQQWRREFAAYADVRGESFPFIVVGNKADIPAAQQHIGEPEVAAWCAQAGIAAHIQTSAKASHNVTDAFALAVRQWRRTECEAERRARQDGAGDIIHLKMITLGQSRLCCSGGGGGGGEDSEGASGREEDSPSRLWGRLQAQPRTADYQL